MTETVRYVSVHGADVAYRVVPRAPDRDLVVLVGAPAPATQASPLSVGSADAASSPARAW